MDVLDLSYPIDAHWRWKFHKTLERDYLLGGPLREEILYLPVHCFTHIDPPLHADIHGSAIDDIPLSRLIGQATLLDFSEVPDNGEITGEDLERKGPDIRGGIVLIRTCRNLKYTLDDPNFWCTSPYMSKSAGAWLVSRHVSAVGFDFPQDRKLRDFFTGVVPTLQELPMHDLLLKNGILQLEYLTNLDQIQQSVVQLFAIPLRLAHTAGSPARVFAIQETHL